jgi:hypothetical protein
MRRPAPVDMKPLETRKRLLLAESDLLRVQVSEDVRRLVEAWPPGGQAAGRQDHAGWTPPGLVGDPVADRPDASSGPGSRRRHRGLAEGSGMDFHPLAGLAASQVGQSVILRAHLRHSTAEGLLRHHGQHRQQHQEHRPAGQPIEAGDSGSRPAQPTGS